MSFPKSSSLWTMGLIVLFSCAQETKTEADHIFYNANIYTVDDAFSKAEAMAVKDGKILAIGKNESIRNQYKAAEETDLKGQTIIPGIYDAHAHFLELGKSMQMVDLTGTQSFEELIERVKDFQAKENPRFIRGHGWDQSDWPGQEFPTKHKLDSLFPDTPIALTRVDLHAMLVNQKALDLAGIDENSAVEGGDFLKIDGKLTGTLLDNAMDGIYKIMPPLTKEEEKDALLKAQDQCFSYGITTMMDAALSHEQIQAMDQLALAGDLKIGLYPLLLYTDPHLDAYLNDGLGDNEAISCRAVKLFGDGALGSRGAALLEPYSDDPNNYGLMRLSPEGVDALVKKIGASDFQLNAHAIGDSTNQVLLKAFDKELKDKPNRRWRIEHAQIVEPKDLKYFSENIIPSVQPTHAISDMKWVETRLGKERTTHAYANKQLLDQAGLIALGTDAPVEELNPFRTFYASVARKNRKGEPKEGFQMENALSREETLKGMTIWAAYAQFEEETKGSLEPGKQADFVILDRNLMEIPIDEVWEIEVRTTYVKGEQVYQNLPR